MSQPRILLLGDYSNCHATLARGLSALGCDVTVASDGSRWMDCRRDISIVRRDGFIGSVRYLLDTRRLVGGKLRGYDIVAVNDPCFFRLRPHRLRGLFDRLKRGNGAVFYTAMSTDLPFLDMLAAPDSPLRYSEWLVDGRPSRMQLANPGKWDGWHAPELVDYQNYFFDNVDGAVSVLYEYHLGMVRRLGAGRAAYGGIPIDLNLIEPVAIAETPRPVRLFLGRDRNRKLVKGSDLLEAAAQRVVERHPGKAELVIVENRPFDEFIALLRSSHVVLDQIYSYTPATTALMAMGAGLNAVSGGEPDYYDFIGEADNRPVINAPIDLDALTDAIEQVVMHPEQIAERGRLSREFVKKHNEVVTVARRFLSHWGSLVNR